MWCTHQGGNQNGFESSEMVGSPQHRRLYMHSPPCDPSESANICELMGAKRALEIAFDKQFQKEINGTCCRVPTGISLAGGRINLVRVLAKAVSQSLPG
jgi:hypothetical protein